jgi:hypothetical protein
MHCVLVRYRDVFGVGVRVWLCESLGCFDLEGHFERESERDRNI